MLQSDGIVTRKDFQAVPPQVEYALTEFGATLRDALIPLCEWGHAHQDRITVWPG
jgi:DNA-binding HxlR family transcriptional regulator